MSKSLKTRDYEVISVDEYEQRELDRKIFELNQRHSKELFEAELRALPKLKKFIS